MKREKEKGIQLGTENIKEVFDSVWQSASDAMALSDENGKVIAANSAYFLLYGYSENEIVNKDFAIIFPSESRKWARDIYRKRFIEKHIQPKIEVEIQRKDGTKRVVESRYTFVANNGKRFAMLSIIKDVTEKKHSEHKLETNEKKFRYLIEHSSDVMALVDENGTFTYLSPSVKQVLGFTAEELIGRNIVELIPPDQVKHVFEKFKSLSKKQGLTEIVEHKYLHKDGSVSWLESTVTNLLHDPVIHSYVSNFRDIGTRKKAEEKQQFLNEVSNLLTKPFDQEMTLSDIARLIITYLADYCRVAIVDTHGNVKEIEVNHTDPQKVVLANALYFEYKDKPNVTHGLQKILQTGKPEIIRKIDETVLKPVAHNKKLVSIVKKIGLKSYMGVPLIARNKVIGAMTLSSIRQNRYYSKEDLIFVENMAQRIALTLDNIRLYHEAEAERKKLDELLMQAPAAIALLEGPDHIFVMANQLCLKLLGKRDVIGKPGRMAIPEFNSQGVWDILDRVYKTGNPFAGNEFPAQLDRLGNGKLDQRYFNFIGQPIYDFDRKIKRILIHAVDVTEQVKAKHNLQMSEAKLRRIVESNIIGIIFYDVMGKITEANDAFLKLMGYTKTDLKKGRIQLDTISPKEYVKDDTKALEEIKVKGVCAPYEKEFFRKDGSRISVFIGAASLDQLSNERVAFVLDITDRKQLERQKDDFIGIATHELKTPVTSIKAYTQALERRFKKSNDETSAYHLKKMDAQVNKLTNLISDLLDVTKIEGGQLQLHIQKFKFDELVMEVVEELQRTTEKHTITMNMQAKKHIISDRERIGQVLTNLISNAIKYSPNSSKIIVDVSQEKQNVAVCVRDFGIGIPKDKQDKLFERFYRVSSPHGETFPGLGLGLYISSEIVKRLGGRIWVESSEGKGSSFCFTMPLKKQSKKA